MTAAGASGPALTRSMRARMKKQDPRRGEAVAGQHGAATMSAISHHAALIYTMVMVSAVDRDMTDNEMRMIGQIVNFLPIFDDYEKSLLPTTAAACADLLDSNDGLENVFALIKEALPPRLRETAYALACEVAAADSTIRQEELRLLEMTRDRLGIERLVAAAIERGARARFVRADVAPGTAQGEKP